MWRSTNGGLEICLKTQGKCQLHSRLMHEGLLLVFSPSKPKNLMDRQHIFSLFGTLPEWKILLLKLQFSYSTDHEHRSKDASLVFPPWFKYEKKKAKIVDLGPNIYIIKDLCSIGIPGMTGSSWHWQFSFDDQFRFYQKHKISKRLKLHFWFDKSIFYWHRIPPHKLFLHPL